MSWTFFFHCTNSQAGGLAECETGIRGLNTLPPFSSSHNFSLMTLAARLSASFSVSPGATAAKTRTPLPIEETSSFSTVTDAESTRCSIAAGD